MWHFSGKCARNPNTSEVIQKRLLVKADVAKPALAKVWQEKGDILRNQLAFDPTTTTSLRPYASEGEFIELPPFVPWHYQILQKVFESIRTKGAAGKQLAMGERSQLEEFQTAAQKISPLKAGFSGAFLAFVCGD
ncbi:DNA repair protein|nr:DNA repair protein [Candidatus Pantoea persica]